MTGNRTGEAHTLSALGPTQLEPSVAEATGLFMEVMTPEGANTLGALRIPVGDDAVMVTSARRQLGDVESVGAVRQTLNLT